MKTPGCLLLVLWPNTYQTMNEEMDPPGWEEVGSLWSSSLGPSDRAARRPCVPFHSAFLTEMRNKGPRGDEVTC